MWVGECGHRPQPAGFGRELLCTGGDQCRRLDPCRWLVELWSAAPPILLRRPSSICASHWSGRFNTASLSWKCSPWCSRLHWRPITADSWSETWCWVMWFQWCSPPPLLHRMGLGQNVLAVKCVAKKCHAMKNTSTRYGHYFLIQLLIDRRPDEWWNWHGKVQGLYLAT